LTVVEKEKVLTPPETSFHFEGTFDLPRLENTERELWWWNMDEVYTYNTSQTGFSKECFHPLRPEKSL